MMKEYFTYSVVIGSYPDERDFLIPLTIPTALSADIYLKENLVFGSGTIYLVNINWSTFGQTMFFLMFLTLAMKYALKPFTI